MNNIEVNIIRKYCTIENEAASISNHLQKFITYAIDDISPTDKVKLIDAKNILTNIHFEFSYEKAIKKIEAL